MRASRLLLLIAILTCTITSLKSQEFFDLSGEIILDNYFAENAKQVMELDDGFLFSVEARDGAAGNNSVMLQRTNFSGDEGGDCIFIHRYNIFFKTESIYE